MSDRDGYPVQVEIPVNHWLFTGLNDISIRIWPVPGEDHLSPAARAMVMLGVRPSGAPREEHRPLFGFTVEAGRGRPIGAGHLDPSVNQFVSEPARGGEPQSLKLNADPSRKEVRAAMGLDLRVPFPRWSFLDGYPLVSTSELKASLLERYETIWTALRARSSRRILPMFSHRVQELATAFGLPESKFWQVLDLEAASEDPRLSLCELDDASEIEIFGTGRLARCARWDGAPLIAFTRTDGSVSQYYDIIFSKLSGEWTIVR